jgi:hypothetical protein
MASAEKDLENIKLLSFKSFLKALFFLGLSSYSASNLLRAGAGDDNVDLRQTSGDRLPTLFRRIADFGLLRFSDDGSRERFPLPRRFTAELELPTSRRLPRYKIASLVLDLLNDRSAWCRLARKA